jgi:hypothetical protein
MPAAHLLDAPLVVLHHVLLALELRILLLCLLKHLHHLLVDPLGQGLDGGRGGLVLGKHLQAARATAGAGEAQEEKRR